ncbi:MAG: hypothetical protein ACWGSQ_09130 [Longimicrobiales bacterium]
MKTHAPATALAYPALDRGDEEVGAASWREVGGKILGWTARHPELVCNNDGGVILEGAVPAALLAGGVQVFFNGLKVWVVSQGLRRVAASRL